MGYQAAGTLGRVLVDGIDEVKLFGETINVQAEICVLAGISGHADREGLIRWISEFGHTPKRVFIVHGEDDVTDSFAQTLKEQLGLDAEAPYSGYCYDLITNSCISSPEPRRITEKAQVRKAMAVFDRLLAAGRRLMSVIRSNEGGTNKDLTKFTNEINSLCDKWER